MAFLRALIKNPALPSGASDSKKSDTARIELRPRETLSVRKELSKDSPYKGGDPATPSGTATLLRLSPPYSPHLRPLLPLRVRPRTSGADNSGDLTGSVYKTRERIHRSIADLRLLAIPPSCSRVADCNLNWGRIFGISFSLVLRMQNGETVSAANGEGLRGIAALCCAHCSMCEAPDVTAMLT